jgi:hypothetical protein
MLHHRWASRQPLEGASWLQQHPSAAAMLRPFASSTSSMGNNRATSLKGLPAPSPGGAGDGAAEDTTIAAAAAGSKPREDAAGSSEACAGLAAALEHCQQEAQLDTLSRQHSAGKQTQQPGAAGAAAASARVTADGIVEAPHLLHAQQAWMAAQLFDAMPPCVVPDNRSDGNGNTSSSSASSSSSALGGWHRVDVWTGMFHAHAAVVIRDARFEGQSRDVFRYLVDHMSLG